jgi:Fe-S oxidoreductase
MRPAAAYTMGLIDKWAQLAAVAPTVANLLTQTPGLSSLLRKMGGITPHRILPSFPPQTFKDWFARRRERDGQSQTVRGEVLLWPDTFNNYLFPQTARAAVAVLEDAGFRVRIPKTHLCCGRPLYDFGMLDEAKSYLRRILAALAPEIEAGTPIVCLEPSCASVFRDELTNLFPKEDAAQRLRTMVVLLPDFLESVGYRPSQHNPELVGRKAIIHGHCHQKALGSMAPEEHLLRHAGLETEVLDSGCCGLAGSFGYETEHYDLSMKIGDRVLLPAVRSASRDTLVVSDGFSCRQQISHATERRGMHIAEVLAMSLQPGSARRSGDFIETGHTEPEHGLPALVMFAAATLVTGILALVISRRPRPAAGSAL